MKPINYSLIRTVVALIIGSVLVIWPDAAADYLVITIGILFIIPGLIGIIGYFVAGPSASRFPVEAIGSFLLGIWLLILPGSFVNILMYLLGSLLLLGSLHQLYTLILVRRMMAVPVYSFIVPVLIFISGLFILFSPRDSQRTIFIVIGIAAIIYAAAELFNYFRFINRKSKLPAQSSDIADAEILED